MKILAIGAHPDDIEIGCYGTLKKAVKQSHEVEYLVLTAGGDSGDAEVRKGEQLETSLGHVKFGGLKSAFLNNNSGRESIKLIEETINKIKPDIIYSHSHNDNHQDHRSVNRATRSACRFFQGQLLFYEGWSSLKYFKPNCIVKVDDYFNSKLRVLKTFISQSDKFYMNPKVIESIAIFRAAQFGYLGKAEAFEVGGIVL